MSDIKLSHKEAEVICAMEDVCFSEGIGPSIEDASELMQWIGETYPDVVAGYWWYLKFDGEEK